MKLSIQPSRVIPGRLVFTCERCGDGVNAPNTVESEQLVEEFTANHRCEERA